MDGWRGKEKKCMLVHKQGDGAGFNHIQKSVHVVYGWPLVKNSWSVWYHMWNPILESLCGIQLWSILAIVGTLVICADLYIIRSYYSHI